MSLRTTEAMTLLRQLLDAGLIDIPTAQMAMAVAGEFMRAGEQPEELVADLTFSEDGIAVNGRMVLPGLGALGPGSPPPLVVPQAGDDGATTDPSPAPQPEQTTPQNQ